MAVGDAHVFPGFLIPVLKKLFFPKLPTTFPTWFCRCERKKNRLNRGSNSQPPGHESDALTTEPPGRGALRAGRPESILLLSVNFLHIKEPFYTIILLVIKTERRKIKR